MKLQELVGALSPLVGATLAADLVRDFLKIRQDYATGTLERASPGKFVETVVQCLQQISAGKHDAKPAVDAYLQQAEADVRLPDGLRFCAARIARAVYTLRNKRNVAHKAATIDPNLIDLAFAHNASSWIMSEFVRNAGSLSMDQAGRLIALVQAPVGALVEEIDGTRIVLADVPIKAELLILLHGRYPDRTTKAELMGSLTRRNSGSVDNVLRALIQAKRAHGDTKEGYVLTQNGYREAVKAIMTVKEATAES